MRVVDEYFKLIQNKPKIKITKTSFTINDDKGNVISKIEN